LWPQRSLGPVMVFLGEMISTVLKSMQTSRFLMEVNGVAGALFKVCESYSEAHLYLEERFTKEKDDPISSVPIREPPLFPAAQGGLFLSHIPRSEEKRPFQGHHVGFRRAQFDGRSVKKERR
jgi:hypothetical protein